MNKPNHRPIGTGQIDAEVVRVLEEQGGEVKGIFLLGFKLVGCNDLHWLRVQLRKLVDRDVITIEDRGNGRRKIVRLNRQVALRYWRQKAQHE